MAALELTLRDQYSNQARRALTPFGAGWLGTSIG